MASWNDWFNAQDPTTQAKYWGSQPDDPNADMGGAAPAGVKAAADPNAVTAGYVNSNGSYTQPGNTYNGNNSYMAPTAVADWNNPNQSAQMDPSAVNKWLNPSMQWTEDQGMRALGSSASAAGQTFSGQTLKDILGYSQGLASQNWNAAQGMANTQQLQGQSAYNDAWNKANAARTFTQQGSQFDRNLANQMGISENGLASSVQQANASRDIAANQMSLNAQQFDATTPWNQQMQLLQTLIGGQNAGNSLSTALQGYLSNNTIASGNAAGQGAVGGANNTNSAISQIISSLMQGNILNRTLPSGP